MFRRRRRLRFDGIYYITTTKLLAGMNEGRGMKETDKGARCARRWPARCSCICISGGATRRAPAHRSTSPRPLPLLLPDFYSPAGRWVTSYRVLRFFPCGAMFSYLCSTHTPAEVRKAAKMVSPDRPRALGQRLRGACWGRFDAHETEPLGGSDEGRLGLTACVRLVNDAYPNMEPANVRYVFEMRARSPRPVCQASAGTKTNSEHMAKSCAGSGSVPPSFASNGQLFLAAIAIESTPGELESLPAPASQPCAFLPFDGPLPPALPARPTVPLASGQYCEYRE